MFLKNLLLCLSIRHLQNQFTIGIIYDIILIMLAPPFKKSGAGISRQDRFP
jgi:hypothetical protein